MPWEPLRNMITGAIDRHIGWWLLASAVSLVAGWLLPVMTLRQLFVLRDEVSILGAIGRLFEGGEYGLFVIVFLFTVLFPVFKLAVALLVWRRLAVPDDDLHRLLGWVEAFGRWSMLDVFVIALFVVVVKISAFSDVDIHIGLYVFAAAVLLSIVVVRRVVDMARRQSPAGKD